MDVLQIVSTERQNYLIHLGERAFRLAVAVSPDYKSHLVFI